jgi:outer membrane lipoprotein SlyB
VVHGVVSGVKPAEKGDRAVLILRVTSIESNGKTHPISATADSLIAGSTRARNVGAVAGSAAAGALIGSAVGGSKGALIGGIIGGAAGTGAVASSKGYQVSVKEGAELVFKVDHDTKLKL